MGCRSCTSSKSQDTGRRTYRGDNKSVSTTDRSTSSSYFTIVQSAACHHASQRDGGCVHGTAVCTSFPYAHSLAHRSSPPASSAQPSKCQQEIPPSAAKHAARCSRYSGTFRQERLSCTILTACRISRCALRRSVRSSPVTSICSRGKLHTQFAHDLVGASFLLQFFICG